jgi:hypothetical protein
VTEKVAYYAIIRDGHPKNDPSGVARRTFTQDGRLDEALRRNLTWDRDSVIYAWERGEELGGELVEISAAEAAELIERFRAEWGEPG